MANNETLNLGMDAAQQEQALVPAPTIDLPLLVQKEEALSVIQENLNGLGEIRFDKIRMPAGGGLTFEVADESGNLVPVQEIRGVIIGHFPFKAW